MSPFRSPILGALLCASSLVAPRHAGAAGELRVDVRATGAVEIAAAAVPAAELLEELARRTGMTVVYDDVAPPRVAVSVAIQAESMPAALRELLRVTGASYAFKTGRSGKSVDTVIIVGMSQASLDRIRVAASLPPPAAEVVDDALTIDPETHEILVKPMRIPPAGSEDTESKAAAPRARERPAALRPPPGAGPDRASGSAR